MKYSLIKASVFGFSLIISGWVNASLVIGNQEFLDLGLTKAKTVAEVEAMIASDSSLAGYTVATDLDAAMIWSSLLSFTGTQTGWYSLAPVTLNAEQQDILTWATTGIATYVYGNRNNLNPVNGQAFYTAQYYGYINFKDAVTGQFESGHYNVLVDGSSPSAVYKRSATDNKNLTLPNLTGSDHSTQNRLYNYSLFVRSATSQADAVPSPSLAALFALGFLGLFFYRRK